MAGSPIVSHLIQLLLAVGKKYISGRAQYQWTLFHLLHNAPASVMRRVKPHVPRTTTHYTNAYAAPPGVLQEQQFIAEHYNQADEILCAVDLYQLLTPDCLLTSSSVINNTTTNTATPQSGLEQYLKMFHLVVHNASERSEEELKAVVDRFDSAIILQATTSQNSQNIEQIFSIIPLLLSNRAFASLGTSMMEKIMTTKEHQKRAFGLVFSAGVSEEYSRQFLRHLQLDRLDLPETLSMLESFIEWFPLPIQHFDVGIEWIQQLTVHSEVFAAALQQENPSAYDAEGKPVVSALWNLVFQLFHPKRMFQANVTDTQVGSVLNLLHAIVHLSAHSLVDKLWYLLSSSVLPFVDQFVLHAYKHASTSFSSQKQQQLEYVHPHPHQQQQHNIVQLQTQNALAQLATSFAWQDTKILFFDPDALKTLNRYVVNLAPFVCSIFDRLDWAAFLTRLSSYNKPKLINDFGLLYFASYLLFNEYRSGFAPSGVGYPMNSLITESWWSLAEPQAVVSLFTNTQVLLAPLKSASVFIGEDVHVRIQENCQLLSQTVVSGRTSPAVALAIFREISSVLFITVERKTVTEEVILWNLPAVLYFPIINNTLIPIIIHTADLANGEEEVRAMLDDLFFTLARSIRAPIDNPAGYDSISKEQQEFHQKCKGIILQFCSAANENLARLILRVLPVQNSARTSTGIALAVKVELIEATLRTFFSTTTLPQPLQVAAQNLNISINDRRDLIQVARGTASAFTLLVLLFQWKLEVDVLDEYAQWPSDMFELALHFKPNQYRSFDLLPLWFFVLELVSSRRFHPVQCQQDSVQIITYFKELFDSKLEAPIYLAAKTVEIYFYRLIRNKSSAPNPKGDRALSGLIERLLKEQSQSQHKQYASFFRELDGILDPIFDLESLKTMILRHLLPTAQPLLEKLFVN